MNDELVIAEPTIDPKMSMARGRDVASVCKEVVLTHSVPIGAQKHVRIEGWQTIAAAWGCTPGVESVETTPTGVRAKAYLKRDSDGAILSTAFGFCGNEEDLGKIEHSREGMAQTRAMSRVCANKFRFVVVLIDPKLSSTPYEEMTGSVKPPAPPNGSDIQTFTGTLKDVVDNGEYTNGVVKAIRFGTKDDKLKSALKIAAGMEVTVELQKKTSKKGTPYFILLSVTPKDDIPFEYEPSPEESENG